MSLKTRKIVCFALEIVFYGLAGLSFFHFLWLFIQDLFSTDHNFLTLLPYYLCLLLPGYLTVVFHRLLRLQGESKKGWMKVNSFVLGGVSLALLLLEIVYIGVGIYPGALAHRGGVGYPLSSILFLIVCLLLSGALYLFQTKRFYLPNEEKEEKSNRVQSVLIALSFPFVCGFYGDFLLTPAVADRDASLAWCTIPVYLLMLFPSLILLFREIASLFLKPEWVRGKELLFHFLSGVSGLVLVLWMCIALGVRGDFIAVSMTAHFPIDFMGSMMLGPYFLFFLGLLYPLLGFLFFLKKKPE